MITACSIQKVREAVRAARRAGASIGFIPTMGYLHEGHLSLIRFARARGGYVVVSIFVNPLQFNDPKDFEKYPVDLERDSELLQDVGTDLLFLPSRDDMYPPESQTRVTVSRLTAPFEGAHRPGHFEGVTTVVALLFGIVQPDFAVFGEKDFQQLRVIEQMVADLRMPIEIVRGEIVREQDGLAMSSRNVRLSSVERTAALAISRGLRRATGLYRQGERCAETLVQACRGVIEAEEGVALEYVALADEVTLGEVTTVERPARLLVAARVGPVRLIDNASIERPFSSGQ